MHQRWNFQKYIFNILWLLIDLNDSLDVEIFMQIKITNQNDLTNNFWYKFD